MLVAPSQIPNPIKISAMRRDGSSRKSTSSPGSVRSPAIIIIFYQGLARRCPCLTTIFQNIMTSMNRKPSPMHAFLESGHVSLIEQRVDQTSPRRVYRSDDIIEFEPDGTRLVSPRVAAEIVGWSLDQRSCRRRAAYFGLFPVRAGRNLRYRVPDLVHFLARLELHPYM